MLFAGGKQAGVFHCTRSSAKCLMLKVMVGSSIAPRLSVLSFVYFSPAYNMHQTDSLPLTQLSQVGAMPAARPIAHRAAACGTKTYRLRVQPALHPAASHITLACESRLYFRLLRLLPKCPVFSRTQMQFRVRHSQSLDNVGNRHSRNLNLCIFII